jgi:Tol biopolymer transport system component
MKKLITTFLLLTAFLFSSVSPLFSQNYNELYQEALIKEEGEGSLLEAIDIYNQIVEAKKADLVLQAKALLHIGFCFEKLGRDEATKAYQKLVKDYPGQKSEVAIARERLSSLLLIAKKGETQKETEGIKIKQIWTGTKVDNSGTVSLNGEYLSFVDWKTGGIAIRNLKTKKNTSLIEGSYDSPLRYAQYNCISPDGKQIAYNWVNGNSSGLYLIDLERSSPSLLYKQEGETVNPVTWLSEKELIVIVWKSKNKDQVCLFNILDRTMQVLKTFEPVILRQLFSSPDGKYVAYGFENETHNGNVDINIHPMDGKAEISLIKHPANDIGIGWVPGRKEFLFISDRSGTWDLWAIAIDNGKPSGPSKRIYADLGEVQPMGFTENGDCYFGLSRGNVNTYIAPFNAANGDINEKSGKIILGSNLWMSWSPDGNFLSYIKAGEKNSNGWQLTIQEIKTGMEHKLANNLAIAWSPCWSPDGNSILVVGIDKNKSQTEGYEGGIYTVDVKTGKTTEILLLSNYKYNNPTGDALPLTNIRWSLDGNSIFMLFFQDRLVKYDLETGTVETLYMQSHFDRSVLNLSPDGKRLLFAAQSPEQKKSHLYTMPVGGGKEEELCSPQESDNFQFAAWSPDGLFIYFIERIEGTNLWRIPAEGGIPQLVWQSDDRIEGFDIHPNGKQITYAIHEQTTEIRVIEGILQELEKIYSKNN